MAGIEIRVGSVLTSWNFYYSLPLDSQIWYEIWKLACDSVSWNQCYLCQQTWTSLHRVLPKTADQRSSHCWSYYHAKNCHLPCDIVPRFIHKWHENKAPVHEMQIKNGRTKMHIPESSEESEIYLTRKENLTLDYYINELSCLSFYTCIFAIYSYWYFEERNRVLYIWSCSLDVFTLTSTFN